MPLEYQADLLSYDEFFRAIGVDPLRSAKAKAWRLRPSIFGSIRWPRELGAPFKQPLEANFYVEYQANHADNSSHRVPLTLVDYSDDVMHVIAIMGVNVVNPDASVVSHGVLARADYNTPWATDGSTTATCVVRPGFVPLALGAPGYALDPFTVEPALALIS